MKYRSTLLRYCVLRPYLTLFSALALGGSSAFATDILTDNFDTPANADTGIAEGRDLYPHGSEDGWLNWATSGSSMARIWNPSTADRYTLNNNEFYDTSWGGNDASGNAAGGVMAVRTMSWDYRNNSATLGFKDPDGNRLWTVNDNFVSDGSIRYEHRFDEGGTPDHVRGSLPAPDPFTYTQEIDGSGATDGSSWQGTASRDIEAVAKIIESFDPTAKYKVSVDVGRLALNGYNTGATIRPGADGIYGTTDDDLSGTSSRYVNDADSYWGGYQVDLLVGGDADTVGGSSGATFYGQTTDSGAAGYMQALDSDDDTQVIAVDAWGSTSLEYTPGVSGDFSAMSGQNLVVRLAAKEIDGDNARTTSAAFDNLVITKFLAGDANEDGSVDATDVGILTPNLGQAIGQTWASGDFNGDGDVDAFQADGNGDAQLLTSNLLAAPLVETASAAYDPATGELIFNVGAGIGVIGLQSVGNLVPGNIDNGSIFGATVQLDANNIAFFNSAGLPQGAGSTGLMLPTGLTAGDMVFSYTPIGGTTTFVEVSLPPSVPTYATWAVGGEPFDGDANGDGVQDGLAFLLGAVGPSEDASGRLPTVSEDGSGGLVLTFNCLPIASRGTATLNVEHSSDLGVSDAWAPAEVPDADGVDNGVSYVVDTVTEAPLNSVTATIGAAEAGGTGKLFGHLKAENP